MAGIFGPGLIAASEDARKRAGRGRSASKRKGHPMRAMLSVFPLLAIPVIIYNIIAFTAGGAIPAPGSVSPLVDNLATVLVSIPMISGVSWQLTGADALIILCIGLLFLEILKSTGTGTATIMNHGISMILFIICLVEFLMHPNFATSTFFMIVVITLLDVLAGVIVTIVSARRDFAVGEGFGG